MDQVLPALSNSSSDARPVSREICAGPVRICFPFAGGVVGGSHISTLKLIQRLDRTQFTPIIVLHHGIGQVGELLRKEGLDFITLPRRFLGKSSGVPPLEGLRARMGALTDQWSLGRFLKANDVRIVHTNEGPMHISWALPARLAGAKLLWHHRGTSRARGVRYIAPFAASRIVGVSAFALSEVRRITTAARETAVVYSPFDTHGEPVDRVDAHRRLTSELGLDPATHLIGFFGNLIGSKRPDMFIDMMACIARSRPDLPVAGLMFGSPLIDGIEAELRQRIDAHGIADKVRLMGFRYPSARFMAACDIHAVTSVGEPFGRTLIEAMLLRTPVVAVASGGNLEAIDDGVNGLLARVDDPAAMASAVISLLESPERAANIAATAAARAVQRYGVDRHVTEISAIYRSLLADEDERKT